MRILFIEDSQRLQRSVGDGLRKAGYAVDIAGDGEEGLWRAQSEVYDVIVLDLMLPKLDGLTILERLRTEGKDTHVLILTAKDTVEERVQGLQKGADDYLVKPFAFDELLARIQALIRRNRGPKNPKIKIGHIELDTSARQVTVAGRPITLAPREYAVLEYLARRPGVVVSRTEIEQHIYDDAAEPMSNVIDAAVCVLRQKIDLPGRPSLIQTQRRVGYILVTGEA
ncbi:MAG: response regulator transcription factor [Pirellulaceae bacterium]